MKIKQFLESILDMQKRKKRYKIKEKIIHWFQIVIIWIICKRRNTFPVPRRIADTNLNSRTSICFFFSNYLHLLKKKQHFLPILQYFLIQSKTLLSEKQCLFRSNITLPLSPEFCSVKPGRVQDWVYDLWPSELFIAETSVGTAVVTAFSLLVWLQRGVPTPMETMAP